MKLFGKTRDGVIDDLLRAYVSRPTNARQACSDFDPDLANAYIERRVTGASLLRYEAHLSECGTCRQSVVALTRLGSTQPSSAVLGAASDARSGWLFGVKETIGAMSAPQWAMAAAAVIVFAVSLPLFLSRSTRLDNAASESIAETRSDDKAQAPPAPASAAASINPEDRTSSRSGTPPAKRRDRRETDSASVTGTLAANSQAAPSEKRPASEQAKAETKSETPAADEAQRKSGNQVAPQAPNQTGAQAAAEGQGSKTDSDNVRQQQGKDAAQSGEAGGRANEQAQKEKVARAEAPAPRATGAGTESGRSGRGLRRALRDSETGEAVRVDQKKVAGKNFLLKDGTWTDKDFNPDKDLPIVTIIRDSNVYNELLGKRPSLKPYLTGFSATERAIIVYKGTVYKLIPQQSDK